MGILLRVAGLLAVYLLVLTSVAPGDILIGSLLAIALVAAARPRDRRPEAGWLSWARAVARMFLDTAVEITRRHTRDSARQRWAGPGRLN